MIGRFDAAAPPTSLFFCFHRLPPRERMRVGPPVTGSEKATRHLSGQGSRFAFPGHRFSRIFPLPLLLEPHGQLIANLNLPFSPPPDSPPRPIVFFLSSCSCLHTRFPENLPTSPYFLLEHPPFPKDNAIFVGRIEVHPFFPATPPVTLRPPSNSYLFLTNPALSLVHKRYPSASPHTPFFE